MAKGSYFQLPPPDPSPSLEGNRPRVIPSNSGGGGPMEKRDPGSPQCNAIDRNGMENCCRSGSAAFRDTFSRALLSRQMQSRLSKGSLHTRGHSSVGITSPALQISKPLVAIPGGGLGRASLLSLEKFWASKRGSPWDPVVRVGETVDPGAAGH